MDWLDYREMLNIGFNDKAKVTYFLNKIGNFLNTGLRIADYDLNEIEVYKFYDITGTPIPPNFINYDKEYKNMILKVLHEHKSSLEEFLSYYIAFINCLDDSEEGNLLRDSCKKYICRCLDEAHIPFELHQYSDGYYIFPRGILEFDSALVSAPLKWLSSYPKAEKAWEKSLRKYADNNRENASDVADSFRKALEAFFQEFFGGQKTLGNYKSEYGDYLKQRGIPKEIAGNFETVLQLFINYNNSYAKHHDATSDKVLEYLMYQTGNIIRLLITLETSGQEDS